MMRGVLLALLLAADLSAAVRVLIVSGRNNHDWRETTPAMRRILERAGGFDVRVTEEPGALSAAALANYDVLVMDYQGPRLGASAESAIEEFVRGGRGLVAVHGSSYTFCGNEILGDRHVRTGKREPAWPAWRQIAGACWTDSEEPKSGHGARHIFDVKFRDTAHPIAAGMQASFPVSDELYHQLRLTPSAKVIATAFSAKETGGTGREEPILWTVEFGRGRVFHTALGHDGSAMHTTGFATTLARGAEWAATGKVTLPAAIRPFASKENALRVLVVNAGHDHEPSFYSLFDSPDLRVMTDSQPYAYSRDLLERFDVIVTHDMYNEPLNAQAQANLRAFLEAGRGMVLTHHALSGMNNWEWFWREVMGGRYLFKAENGRPASSYKHDVDLVVTPVGKHPVLEGVPPLVLHDETYKGLWFSPENTPLLRTDHPTSDPVVGWVAPYKKARVVVIQPGHDSSTHYDPGYRRLIRNAMFWVANRGS